MERTFHVELRSLHEGQGLLQRCRVPHLGFSRIAISEAKVPNLFANPLHRVTPRDSVARHPNDERRCNATTRPRPRHTSACVGTCDLLWKSCGRHSALRGHVTDKTPFACLWQADVFGRRRARHQRQIHRCRCTQTTQSWTKPRATRRPLIGMLSKKRRPKPRETGRPRATATERDRDRGVKRTFFAQSHEAARRRRGAVGAVAGRRPP